MKLAMHNWMRAEDIETTLKRLGRYGYSGIEISGEPELYDVLTRFYRQDPAAREARTAALDRRPSRGDQLG